MPSFIIASSGCIFALAATLLCSQLLNTPRQPTIVHDSALYRALFGIASGSLGVMVGIIGAAWGLRHRQYYAVVPATVSLVLFGTAIALFVVSWWRGLSFSFK